MKAGGCTLEDIVDVTSFHTNPDERIGMGMAVKDAMFPRAPYPTWTTVGVTWLAGFDFEIKVIARVPEKSAG